MVLDCNAGELEGTEIDGNEKQDMEMYKENYRRIVAPVFDKHPDLFGKRGGNKGKRGGKKKGGKKGKKGRAVDSAAATHTPAADAEATTIVDREKWFGEAAFVNAVTVCASRAFWIDKYHGECMVPLGDMFNHSE